jgi:hypothetical protein
MTTIADLVDGKVESPISDRRMETYVVPIVLLKIDDAIRNYLEAKDTAYREKENIYEEMRSDDDAAKENAIYASQYIQKLAELVSLDRRQEADIPAYR